MGQRMNPLGPMFEIEIRRLSRGPRLAIGRTLLGLLLLGILTISNWGMAFTLFDLGRPIEPRDIPWIMSKLFSDTALVQLVTLWLIVPALIAGAIAGDRETGFLPFVLASRLSSFEIVVGKLAARGLVILGYAAVGIPIATILASFGGIDPIGVAHAAAITFGAISLLSGVSILASTLSARTTDALITVYVLLFAWLSLPRIGLLVLGRFGPRLPSEISVLFELFESTSPLGFRFLLTDWSARPGFAVAVLVLEVFVGLAAVVASVVLLRRVDLARKSFRPSGDPGSTMLAASRGFPFDELHPMRWKQRTVPRMPRGRRIILLVALVPVLGWWAISYFDYAVNAFEELAAEGYGRVSSDEFQARSTLHLLTLGSVAVLETFGMLAVLVAAATAIPRERESRTWESLAATPLESEEILDGVRRGALGRDRLAGLCYHVLVAVGVLSGSLHILLLPGLLIVRPLLRRFHADLGLLVGVLSRKSSRAVGWAIGVWAAMASLPLLILPARWVVLCPPLQVGGFLPDYAEFDRLLRDGGSATLYFSSCFGLIIQTGASYLFRTAAEGFLDDSRDPMRRPAPDPSPGQDAHVHRSSSGSEIRFISDAEGRDASVDQAEESTSETAGGEPGA
ncbi:MAG: hypothetical protein SFX72_00680 [Isosphaeraceae bacterium]|nr:hypothetical protein [Isosphaeraceae bacterium]